jgi:hypothetical protein
MISRGYSVLCVKTLLYFLMFIKPPVKVIHCVIIVARTLNAETEGSIYYHSCRTLSNCLQIVILYRLYAWLWHIWDFDTNFCQYIIPFMAIPCIGILMVRIPKKKILEIVWYSIKLISDCHNSHSICTELAHMDY